jgi:hypothetical protein
MRHIYRADDEIKLEREVLGKLALVVRDHNVMSTELLDVVRLVRGRGEGVDLGAKGVGKENGAVILQVAKSASPYF